VSARVVTGTVEFIWDGDGHMLVNMDPDDPSDPHTFELTGDLRERMAEALEEGARIEVRFAAVPYEVLDPDSGPSESLRAEVLDVRVQARP
jgi:hypothetical protein